MLLPSFFYRLHFDLTGRHWIKCQCWVLSTKLDKRKDKRNVFLYIVVVEFPWKLLFKKKFQRNSFTFSDNITEGFFFGFLIPRHLTNVMKFHQQRRHLSNWKIILFAQLLSQLITSPGTTTESCFVWVETEKVFIHDKKIRSGVKVLDVEKRIMPRDGLSITSSHGCCHGWLSRTTKTRKKDSKDGMWSGKCYELGCRRNRLTIMIN